MEASIELTCYILSRFIVIDINYTLVAKLSSFKNDMGNGFQALVKIRKEILEEK